MLIGWLLLAGTAVLIFTGAALFAVGFFTGNQGRLLRGFGLAVVAVAGLAVGDFLGPAAGVLLLGVAMSGVCAIRRRLRTMAATPTGEQADG